MQDQLYPVPQEPQESPPENLSIEDALRLLRRAAARQGLVMYVDMGLSPYRSAYEIHLSPRMEGKPK